MPFSVQDMIDSREERIAELTLQRDKAWKEGGEERSKAEALTKEIQQLRSFHEATSHSQQATICSLQDELTRLKEKNQKTIDELKAVLQKVQTENSSYLEQNKKEKSEADKEIASLKQSILATARERDLKAQECVSLNSDLTDSIKQQKEIKEALERQVEELKKASNRKIAELEQSEKIKDLTISELNEKLENEKQSHTNDISQLEEQLAIEKEENERAKLIRVKQAQSKPLRLQLLEVKGGLDPKLLAKLINAEENMEGFSLIRWSEQENVQLCKEELMSKKVILTVYDLVKQIKTIKSAYNQKDKVNNLTDAVNRLMQDLEAKILPPSAIKSLITLVSPEIEQEIKEEKTQWLHDLYLEQRDIIKDKRRKKYFSKDNKAEDEDFTALDEQFKKVLKDLRLVYTQYKKQFEDKDLLEKIRMNDPAVSIVSTRIEAKMVDIPIEESPAQHQQAVQAMLSNPTPEMEKLIKDKITKYLEKMKQILDPKSSEIARLQDKNIELQSQVIELQKKLESKPQSSAVPQLGLTAVQQSRSVQSNPDSQKVTTTSATFFISAQGGQKTPEIVVSVLPPQQK